MICSWNAAMALTPCWLSPFAFQEHHLRLVENLDNQSFLGGQFHWLTSDRLSAGFVTFEAPFPRPVRSCLLESALSTLDDKIDNGGCCDFISLPRDAITCLSTCNHCIILGVLYPLWQ